MINDDSYIFLLQLWCLLWFFGDSTTPQGQAAPEMNSEATWGQNVGPWVELKLTEGGNGLGGLGVKGVFLCVWYVTAVEWKMDDM